MGPATPCSTLESATWGSWDERSPQRLSTKSVCGARSLPWEEAREFTTAALLSTCNLLRTGNGRSSLRLDMTSDGAHNDAGLRPAVRIRRWLHRAGCTTLAVKPRSQSQGSGYAYSLRALRACVAPTRRTETRPWRAHRRREGFLGTSPPRRSAANATTDPLQRYRVPTTTHLGLLMASVAKKRSLWYWPERYYPIERPQHESRIIL